MGKDIFTTQSIIKLTKFNNMKSTSICPVPKEQRPQEEFKEFSDSVFYSWPKKSSVDLYMNLTYSWLIASPFCIFIAFGSYSLKTNLTKLLLISIDSSLFLPLVLSIWQWIGWNYIYTRLLSGKIEYEESGWYDGQNWIKPTAWKNQDLLIARYEVMPIIKLLLNTIKIILLSIILLMVAYRIS